MRVELIEYMGSDLTVVNSARVSFDKESEYELQYDSSGPHFTEVLSERDRKLINHLAKNGHWTPFSHCQITLRETIPIFVARQRFKHTVGFSYNEVSRRYVKADPEFYIPDGWRKAAENVKQGSSEELVDPTFRQRLHGDQTVHEAYIRFLNYSEDFYKELIEHGVCPEQARMVLPQSMMTSYYVTGSLAAFARAYRLRSDPHAQKEIQILAEQWDKVIRPLYPVAWSALVD